MPLTTVGAFINYVRAPNEGGGWKNLYIILIWGRGSNPFLGNFPNSIFYIRNHAVKHFGRDHI